MLMKWYLSLTNHNWDKYNEKENNRYYITFIIDKQPPLRGYNREKC